MSSNVSRHLTESHVTLFPTYSSALLPFPCLFFSTLCLRFRYHQDSFRHSKFLLLYTVANSDDPARFLFPITFFFLYVPTYFSRFSNFPFCYRTQLSTVIFFYFLLLYILSSFSPLSLVFGFGFVTFFVFVSVRFHLLSVPSIR